MENSERELRAIDALERIAKALEEMVGQSGIANDKLSDIDYALNEIKVKTGNR